MIDGGCDRAARQCRSASVEGTIEGRRELHKVVHVQKIFRWLQAIASTKTQQREGCLQASSPTILAGGASCEVAVGSRRRAQPLPSSIQCYRFLAFRFFIVLIVYT